MHSVVKTMELFFQSSARDHPAVPITRLAMHSVRRYLLLLVFTASHRTPTSGHQVEDQAHHRDNQQKVNKGAADVKAEAKKPQNQHNHNGDEYRFNEQGLRMPTTRIQ